MYSKYSTVSDYIVITGRYRNIFLHGLYKNNEDSVVPMCNIAAWRVCVESMKNAVYVPVNITVHFLSENKQ